MTIARLLYFENQDFEEIQQIITFTEAANMAKQATSQTKNLVFIVKKKTDDCQ